MVFVHDLPGPKNIYDAGALSRGQTTLLPAWFRNCKFISLGLLMFQ
jgi:hypothetical protein